MRRLPELALGFLVATAIWAILFIFVLDPQTYHQICEADQYGHERCTPHDLPYVVFWYASYIVSAGAITALATAAIAYFTLTLKRSTDRLWEAGERQLEAIRENAERQSRDMAVSVAETRRIGEAQVRAYVDITSVQIILTMPIAQGAGEITLVRIVARNTGQSPARNFLWHPTVQFISSSQPGKIYSLSLGGNWREMIGIGIAVGDQHGDGAMVGRPPLAQLGSGANNMVIRIRIDFEYEDVFGVRHSEEAYFAGVFTRKIMGFNQTDYGPTQWEGQLRRLHRPADWPSEQG